jgi:hypothetical protein
MAILEFRATTIQPAALRALGAGFKAGGQFIVRIQFDEADAYRYEYRQYIRGTAFVTLGAFGPGAPSRANWVPTAPRHDAKNDFEVPGGLRTFFTEDGQRRGGRTQRFGYRSAMPVLEHGLEDRYLPEQKMGSEYRLRDTWGLSGASRPRGLRFEIEIVYRGAVIDRLDGDRVLDTRQWRVQLDDIIV